MNIGLTAPDMQATGSRGGGVATYTLYLAQALLELGHRVHLFTATPESLGPKPHAGLSWHAIPQGSSPRSKALQEELGPDLAWSHELADYLEARSARLSLDVMEGCDISAPLFAAQLRQIADPLSIPFPMVVRLHSLGQHLTGHGRGDPYERANYALDHAESFTVGAAQGRIATTRWTRSAVCGKLGLTPSSAPVIPLPQPAPARPAPQARSRRRVLFAGRLEPRKGPDLLVKALLPWLDRFPDLEAVFLGFDTLTHRKTSMLAHLRGLVPPAHRPRVRFTGPLPPASFKAQLRACAFVVVPSRCDNSPYVALEALAASCPTIATTTSGLCDVIEHGTSGLLCEPDAASLSQALGRLLSTPEPGRRAMGEEARLRVTRLCDPLRVARAQTAFYEKIIREGRRTRLPGNFPFRDAPLSCDARPRAPRGRSTVSVIICGAGAAARRTRHALDRSARPPDEILESAPGAAGRNAAARRARGDCLVFLEAGQRPGRDYLRKAALALDSAPELGFVSPGPSLVFEFPLALVENMAHGASMIRRRAFEQAGGFSAGAAPARQSRLLWTAAARRGWGAIPLSGAGCRVLGGTSADDRRPLAGRASLRRRFQDQERRLRAALARRARIPELDWNRARLALEIWKNNSRRNYDLEPAAS